MNAHAKETPPSQAKPRTRRDWSAEDVDRLTALLRGGLHSLPEIAAVMCRPYISVCAKVRRIRAAATFDEPVPQAKPMIARAEPERRTKEQTVQVKCLRCTKMFGSFDRRRNRICARCKDNGSL